MALTLYGVHHIAKSVLLCETVASGESFSIERTLAKTNLVGETLCVHNPALGLTSEHRLNLLKNGHELHLWGLQQAELPGSRLAPEYGTLGQTFTTQSILANCNVIVRFNSIDFAPEVESLEAHARLKVVQGTFKLHPFFNSKCRA